MTLPTASKPLGYSLAGTLTLTWPEVVDVARGGPGRTSPSPWPSARGNRPTGRTDSLVTLIIRGSTGLGQSQLLPGKALVAGWRDPLRPSGARYLANRTVKLFIYLAYRDGAK